MSLLRCLLLSVSIVFVCAAAPARGGDAPRVKFNHPGLVVDLGVGLWAWPLPMDYDADGDVDLIVTCPDTPSNGVYLFENPGTGGADASDEASLPVFKPAVRLGDGMFNVSVSYVDGKPRILVPGSELSGAGAGDFAKRATIHPTANVNGDPNVRANQWKFADYDGDGAVDLIVGVGSWKDYGWDDAFDENGNWTRGPLHGWVYLVRNTGTTAKPEYAAPVRIEAGGKTLDVFGMPSPNLADFDGDGDLDLLCGDFIGGLTYFANEGTRTEPRYAAGRTLTTSAGRPLVMTQPMIVPTAVDFDGDGDVDLVVGQEDGHVAFVEHTGKVADGGPVFAEPRLFRQQADDLKYGALVTPVSVDWDGDGDEDLIAGNAAGEIGFIENLDGGNPPRWAPPRPLEADGRRIRITAGPNGSIQGPAEKLWGYTTLSVADWDHDGRLDIVVNSIWGKIVWYRNVGSAKTPQLADAQPIRVDWPGKPPKPSWNWWEPEPGTLATQWRTTPLVEDLNGDGLNDLVMLDHEGYLAFFERERRDGDLVLLPGQRALVDVGGEPLRLNSGRAGRSGRRKLSFVDVDRDGRLDLLVNSRNAAWYRQTPIADADGRPRWAFEAMGDVASRKLAGHTTSPTSVDWDGDGVREILIGGEDGRLYHVEAPYIASDPATVDEVKIDGKGYELATLENGGRAFGNRDYVWYGVPAQLDGWRFTRTHGGGTATIGVTVERDATLLLATAVRQARFAPPGWDEMHGLSFGYTDNGRSSLQVFRREVRKGERVEVPQGNWTGSLLLIGPAHAKPGAADAPRGPNVLFIAVDDMRVELGCYGDTIVKSPNIDALAARGTLFDRAYCQQAVCNPSRASLLTGMRLQTLNLWDLQTHFRQRVPDVVTLPQHFKQRGYFTQNIGKVFHNWRQDDYKGDPVSWSVPAVMHYDAHGNDRAQIDGRAPPTTTQVPRCEARDVPDEAYFDGRIAALAVDALGELEAKGRPWFLAVGFWKPHAPFNAPKKYWDLYDRDAIEMPANPRPPRGVPPIALHDSREILSAFRKRPDGRPTSEETRTLRHGYYAAISYVDAQIGKVIAELDRRGLAENTIIVLWSDHGFHLGEHDLWAKTSNFELDARVPLIIVTPGGKGAQRCRSVVELLDLYPTLTDLCGLALPEHLEGVSLKPALDDPAATIKPAAFTWHCRPAYPSDRDPFQAMGYSMRTERYRYTEWRSVKDGSVIARELYDHEQDPRETENLAHHADRTADVKRLALQLAAAMKLQEADG